MTQPLQAPTHPPLLGEFINLRALTVDDAATTLQWRTAHRARFLNAGATTVEQQAAWIAKRPASEYNYIIERQNGHPIGMLSLIGIDLTNRHGEPSRFLIGDEAAAQGIPAAVEAMKLLYELAFEQLGLVRVCGIIAANNTLMIKWQKYLGMKEEGRLRNHLCQNGQWIDAIYLGLLAEEYRKTTRPRMNGLIQAARAQTESTEKEALC